MTTLTFQMSPDKLQAIKQKLSAEIGLCLPDGNAGTTTFKGITVDCQYEATVQLLHLTVTKHPLFEPEGLIDSKITEWMNEQ